MRTDEFAFFNQQLAAMLRDGIPLEGALKQLSQGMRTGALRNEIVALESDLAKGMPLSEALNRRSLPPLYVRMVQIGAQSNDLPGVLTVIADHYHRSHVLWTRLKGLLVYPVLVIVVSLGLTLLLSLLFGRILDLFMGAFAGAPPALIASVWIPPIVLFIAAVLIIVAIYTPRWRAWLRWRLPAFREASLAQLASVMALMLRNGVALPEALAMAEAMESPAPSAKVLAEWRRMVESGQGKPAQWPAPPRPIPPLFVWLVQKAGADLAAGFQKASEIYQARASYRIEMALYGALPVSILLVAQMVFWQAAPLFRGLAWIMNMVGDTGG
jgi:type II secretory pathway component PulF